MKGLKLDDTEPARTNNTLFVLSSGRFSTEKGASIEPRKVGIFGGRLVALVDTSRKGKRFLTATFVSRHIHTHNRTIIVSSDHSLRYTSPKVS